MKIKILNIEDYLILVLILSSLIIFPILQQSQIATYGIIPAVFLYFLFKDIYKKKTSNKKFFNIFLFFFFWGFITTIWAIDHNVAIKTQRRILIIILYSYSIISFANKSENNIILIFKAHAITLIILLAYVFFVQGIKIDIGNNIQEQFEFNSNTYGYYIFIGFFSSIIIFFYSQRKVILFIIILMLTIGSSILLFLTASRGGFIIFGMSIFLILIAMLKSQKQTNYKFITKATLLFVVFYFIGIFLFETFFSETYLYTRFFQLKEYASPRTLHFYEAIKVGWNHPFGVGGGNYSLVPRSFEQGSFSHNGFSEAFANYGYIGLFLYIGMFFEYYKSIRKISKQEVFAEQQIINIHYVFFIAFLSYNIFYIPYLTLEFIGIFFAFRCHLKLLQSKLIIDENPNFTKYHSSLPKSNL